MSHSTHLEHELQLRTRAGDQRISLLCDSLNKRKMISNCVSDMHADGASWNYSSLRVHTYIKAVIAANGRCGAQSPFVF